MDFVSYEAAPLHTRGTNHRQGSFRYKDLGIYKFTGTLCDNI